MKFVYHVIKDHTILQEFSNKKDAIKYAKYYECDLVTKFSYDFYEPIEVVYEKEEDL